MSVAETIERQMPSCSGAIWCSTYRARNRSALARSLMVTWPCRRAKNDRKRVNERVSEKISETVRERISEIGSEMVIARVSEWVSETVSETGQ